MRTQIRCQRVDWQYRAPFRIAYLTLTHSQTVLVEVVDRAVVGRGEGFGVPYHGETAETLLEQLAAFDHDRPDTFSRAELQQLLPAGGARNALDCALWDIEAKRSRSRAWELAKIPTARPLTTAYTLGLDAPDNTARAAQAAAAYGLLKVKLNGVDDVERLSLIRRARPDAELMVDANQSWTAQHLADMLPRLVDLGVTLIEQPLPVDQDAALEGLQPPIPLCADESCQTSTSLAGLVGKYQYVNIKLDKTGGLTEALRVVHAAAELGFARMVGCMGGSSLSMAPAFVVGQLCSVADLDSPLLIRSDVPDAIRYDGSRMSAPSPQLWG